MLRWSRNQGSSHTPDAGDAMLALREVGPLVQETRDRVHVAADLGPPRHPGVAGVDGDALRPALVRHELRRVVDQLADVVLVPGDAGERGERAIQFEPRERLVREPGRALEAGDAEERVREQLVAERAAAAQGDVALRLERRRRLVVGAETGFQVIAAASRVGGLEGDPPRQLALDARGELVHVRHDEVGVREVRAAAEERLRAQRASGRRLDPVGPGVRQRVGRRTAAVSRRDHVRAQAEPGVVALTRRVEEVLAVAGAEDGLLVERVGHADAGLPVVLVELPRPIRGAVHAGEPDAAHDLLPDARRHRIDDRRVERVVQHVVLFRHGPVDVPAEAEVHRQLVVDAPVVLDPGRHEEPLVVRLRVDVHVAAARRAEQEGGEGVALELAGAVQRAAREVPVERDVAARVVVVLVEDVGPPHVETAADVVRAAGQRHVRLKRVVAVPVRRVPRDRVANWSTSITGKMPPIAWLGIWSTRLAGQNSVESKPIARIRNSSTPGNRCSCRAG